MGVGGSEKVEISVDKLERKYEESYFVDVGQRVKFPHVYSEPRCLQMLLLKGECPLLENDAFSNNCPLSFCDVPGKARRCFYDLVPSAWNDRKSMKWCYDERYFDKKIELFEVNRGYNELVERVDIERVNNICLLYTSRCV